MLSLMDQKTGPGGKKTRKPEAHVESQAGDERITLSMDVNTNKETQGNVYPPLVEIIFDIEKILKEPTTDP